jgi:hypothetical protein
LDKVILLGLEFFGLSEQFSVHTLAGIDVTSVLCFGYFDDFVAKMMAMLLKTFVMVIPYYLF